MSNAAPPTPPTEADYQRPSDISLAVIATLFRFMTKHLVQVEDWDIEVRHYLAARPLWEIVILQYLYQHLEDVFGGVRRATPNLTISSEEWNELTEPDRLHFLVNQVLGLDFSFYDDRLTDFLYDLDQLAREELMFRTAIDDRPQSTVRASNWQVSTSMASSPVSKRALRFLAQLPTGLFTTKEAATATGRKLASASYYLHLLTTAQLVAQHGRLWQTALPRLSSTSPAIFSQKNQRAST